MFGNREKKTFAEVASPEDSGRRLTKLKKELHRRLLKAVDMKAFRTLTEDELRREFRAGAEELCRTQPDLLTQVDRKRLIEELVDEALGLGPLEPLLRDSTINDILINGPDTVYVERDGCLELSDVQFDSEEHLLAVVRRIADRVGRRIDEACPMVDARLPDGSRVNALIRPVALDGALVSIRRFGNRPLVASELVAKGSLTSEMLDFLGACVRARLNILISGGTGSGKTTLLNLLSGFIPPNQRVATIEDSAELRLSQPHVARMETRLANLEGAGEVTSRDLLRNALRMRPDRIIVGECRGDEALDMLQAMNTGHDGSLTTIHANTARDAIGRLEVLVGMASGDLPHWVIPRQIASAVQIVVQVARVSGGKRKVVQISEVVGIRNHEIELEDLFVFEQTTVGADGEAAGYFRALGRIPRCISVLTTRGMTLDERIFRAPSPSAKING